jgi:hypothetical protein
MSAPLCVLGSDKYRSKCQYCNIDRVEGTFTCSVDDTLLARPFVNIEGKKEIDNYYLISRSDCNLKKFNKKKKEIERQRLPNKK